MITELNSISIQITPISHPYSPLLTRTKDQGKRQCAIVPGYGSARLPSQCLESLLQPLTWDESSVLGNSVLKTSHNTSHVSTVPEAVLRVLVAECRKACHHTGACKQASSLTQHSRAPHCQHIDFESEMVKKVVSNLFISVSIKQGSRL